jgi:hypothetical protein
MTFSTVEIFKKFSAKLLELLSIIFVAFYSRPWFELLFCTSTIIVTKNKEALDNDSYQYARAVV